MLDVGFRIGPYEIVRPIDLGTTEAYLAYDHDRQREATLQIYRTDVGADAERLRAFEADVGPAVLIHPNILELYDVGMCADVVYVALAPIDGDRLQTCLDARSMSLGRALRWSGQLARALAAAHLMGVPHGHLSAETLVVDAKGCLVVFGFGLVQVAPPERRGSDVRAFSTLSGTMLRSGWQATPLRSRAVLAAGLVALVAAIGWMALRASFEAAPDQSQAAAPSVAVTPAVRPADGRPPSDAPAAALSAEAPAAAPALPLPSSQPAAPSTSEAGDVAGPPASVPVPPPSKPAAPSAVEAPLAPTPSASPVRPLTPVVVAGRDVASLMTEASVRATEFDLAGAFELAETAASRGDPNARVAALYVRGLLDAREAFRDGGPAGALAPVREAIATLQTIAQGRPGSTEIARLTLQAAAAAAQSERDEMSLYLETALEMEALQRVAGLPGAPLVSAAEVAGDLWLQVHRYEDAQRVYGEAIARIGSTLRILSGLARTARRLDDMPAACGSYRRLLEAWGRRPGLPVEIAEARAYIGGCGQ
jgi:hypothetical protein